MATRQGGLLKSADVYMTIVEGAARSGKAEEIAKLLAESSKLYATSNVSPEKARKLLEGDLAKWTDMDARFVSCTAELVTDTGQFECETVGTRRPPGGTLQHAVYGQRFHFGPPKFKYAMFGELAGLKRKWGPI